MPGKRLAGKGYEYKVRWKEVRWKDTWLPNRPKGWRDGIARGIGENRAGECSWGFIQDNEGTI